MPRKQNTSNKPLSILYQDDCYLAVDKPARLLVIPSPKKERTTLTTIVNSQFSSEKDNTKWHPCHRLDRDTSGVMLFARGKRHQQLMMEEFKQRRVEKQYIALVNGRLKKPQGEIKKAIRTFDQKKFTKNSRAKSAITRYKVIRTKRQFSVVEVYPTTGRTNQIRIHFSQMGHPLVGEQKYAFRRDSILRFRRTALHAAQLEWVHPVDQKKIKTTAPLPKDMEVFIAKHR